MSSVTAKPEYTPEDLLRMPDGDLYEFVDGQLVEHQTGTWSSYIGGQLFYLVSNFREMNPLGWVLPAGTSYQCFPGHHNKVRKPNVSFVRLGRFPNEQVPEGHILIPPDLAVAVVSPNDLVYETDQKVEEYLRAGVVLVWVVHPEARTVLIYRADGSIEGVREQGELSGEDVLPGFRCRVADLFRTSVGNSPAGSGNP